MPLSDLTPVEFAVLEAAAAGETGPDHARRVGVSPSAIQSRRKSLRRKLGARTMAQAVAIAAAERETSGETEPTAKQIACLHGRADELDQKLKRAGGESKRRALETVAREYGIPAESVKDLNYAQVSFAIDIVTAELRSVPA